MQYDPLCLWHIYLSLFLIHIIQKPANQGKQIEKHVSYLYSHHLGITTSVTILAYTPRNLFA